MQRRMSSAGVIQITSFAPQLRALSTARERVVLKENCFVLSRIRISPASTWFVLNSKSLNLISLLLISKGIIPDLRRAE